MGCERNKGKQMGTSSKGGERNEEAYYKKTIQHRNNSLRTGIKP